MFITGCAPQFHQSLCQLLATKCGDVEEWDSQPDPNLMTVVFKSMDALAVARGFDGMPFGSRDSRLLIRVADEQEGGRKGMLLLAAPPNADQLSAAETIKRRRRELMELFNGPSESTSDGKTQTSQLEGDTKDMLNNLCYRQCKALSILTSSYNQILDADIEKVEEQISLFQSVLEKQKARQGYQRGIGFHSSSVSTGPPLEFEEISRKAKKKQ